MPRRLNPFVLAIYPVLHLTAANSGEVVAESPRRPLLIATAASLAAAAYVWWYYARAVPDAWSDFDLLWHGARALLAGRDPYAVVREFSPWLFYYPLPAALLAVPFAPLSQLGARVAFAAASAGLTVWAVLRYRPHLWPVLCSLPFVYAIQRGQVVPLLIVAALAPSAASGTILATKPNIALAVLAYRPSWRAVLGAVGLGLLSLVVLPSWPVSWLQAVRDTPHIHPAVLLPGGAVLLLALTRWREPGARLLGALALIPQTRALYELLPLALVPSTRRGAVGIALLWNVLALLVPHHWNAAVLRTVPGGTGSLSTFDQSWWPILLLGYLPVLWLILARPPGTARRAVRLAWSAVLTVLAILTLILAWFVWRERAAILG